MAAALDSIPERIAEKLGAGKPEQKPEKPPLQGTRLLRFFGWQDKEVPGP